MLTLKKCVLLAALTGFSAMAAADCDDSHKKDQAQAAEKIRTESAQAKQKTEELRAPLSDDQALAELQATLEGQEMNFEP